MIIFDIEADNLLDDVTTVHCIVMQDTETGKVWKFDPTQLDVALDWLKEADAIVAAEVEERRKKREEEEASTEGKIEETKEEGEPEVSSA